MKETIQSAIDKVVEIVTTYGLSVLGAIVILIVGWNASNLVADKVYKALGKLPNADETLNRFLSSLVRYTIKIFTVLAVLSQFGIQTASLVAILGAAGLAIGLALQGTLSHVASGVMLLIFRPFKIGDYIEAGGVSGTVKDIGLFVTDLATAENIHIVVPNGKIWDTVIRNFSHNKTRRINLTIGIGYNDDIKKAKKIINDILSKDERVLKDPEHLVAVSGLGDNAVDIRVRAWTKKDDFWETIYFLNQEIKETFDKKGISIPYPQRDIHIVSDCNKAK